MIQVDQSLKFFFDHRFSLTSSNSTTDPIFKNLNGSFDGADWNYFTDESNLVITDPELDAVLNQYPDFNNTIYMETPQEVFPSIIKFAPCRYCSGKFSMNLEKKELELIQQLLEDEESIETWSQPRDENNYAHSYKLQLGLIDQEEEFEQWQVDMSSEFETSVEMLNYLPNFSPIVFHASLEDLGNVSQL